MDLEQFRKLIHSACNYATERNLGFTCTIHETYFRIRVWISGQPIPISRTREIPFVTFERERSPKQVLFTVIDDINKTLQIELHRE